MIKAGVDKADIVIVKESSVATASPSSIKL